MLLAELDIEVVHTMNNGEEDPALSLLDPQPGL